MLVSVEPCLDVLHRAIDLVKVPDGAVVVLVPDANDAIWLNQERPIFSQRRFRTLLYCDSEASKRLARQAPDFFHWISHRIEVPQSAWPPAVFGLRSAATNKAHVAWQGGDFDACFAAAFPNGSFAIQSAAITYDGLVELFENEHRTLLLKDVDSSFRLRRIRWALAESKRSNMVVLDKPFTSSDEFWSLHALPAHLDEAMHSLRAAGANGAGRLAAVLHLEPELIDIACNMLRRGIPCEQLVELALKNDDPGIAIVEHALAQELALNNNTAPVARTQERKTAGDAKTTFSTTNLPETAMSAYVAGDSEVALRWARAALSHDRNSIEALMTFANISMALARFEDAEKSMQQALHLQEKTNDKFLRMQILIEMASLQHRTGQLQLARRTIEKVLRLQKKLVSTNIATEHAHALTVLGRISQQQGDLQGAEQALRKALELKTTVAAENARIIAESRLDLARVLCERRTFDEASELIKQALEIYQSLHGHEHTRIAVCFQDMARVHLLKGEFRLAKQALEEAIAIHQKLGGSVSPPDYATALHALGSTLNILGDPNEAAAALEKSMQLNRQIFATNTHPSIATSLHELGLVELTRGNLAQARQHFQRTLEIERKLYTEANHYQVAITESNLGMVLAMMGERNAGLNLVRSAHDVLLKKLGHDHPATRDAAEKLAQFS